MSTRLEDYALIGDCQTAALVSREGSIDWLCLPRFDSGACFAALLGDRDNGRWLLRPKSTVRKVSRRYEPGTLVLETTWETEDGVAKVLDFMPYRGKFPDVVRIVRCVSGHVEMTTELVVRFDYGEVVPWVTRRDDHKQGLDMIGGPDMLRLATDVRLKGKDFRSVADFTVRQGQSVPFVLTWYPSYRSEPEPVNAEKALDETRGFWSGWANKAVKPHLPKIAGCAEAQAAVERSLLTLKAMTYDPSGGIVAAVTTSLPETLGGERNWDYRFCWIRDATLTLRALETAGFQDEAKSWYQWLLRAVAGKPSQMQIMYSITGERRLTELTLPWLSGYEGSKPVRIGNAASNQFQLDCYGEVMDALHSAWRRGIKHAREGWNVQMALIEFLEEAWHRPDRGIWEVRGGPKNFTYSKVMAWVAFDRAIKTVQDFKVDAPVDRWSQIRDQIHAEVCARGYNEKTGTFTQYYGSDKLDASLLLLPTCGFLPATDPRMKRTIEAIEKTLTEDGLVLRYRTDGAVDGLTGHEGTFLACSFWLVDCLSLLGRQQDAIKLFNRLLALRNDVGLLAEEYDTRAKRLVGNFPQAFSHLALINGAHNLGARPSQVQSLGGGPAGE